MSARFHLDRREDATGVSGTGRVAEGVLFADGRVAMRWLVGLYRSTVAYDSIEDVEAIHGHDGRTQIVFEDDYVTDDDGTRPAESEPTAWRDRQGDVWSLGADGLLHSPGTAPFSREHVERKWGPLVGLRPAESEPHDAAP